MTPFDFYAKLALEKNPKLLKREGIEDRETRLTFSEPTGPWSRVDLQRRGPRVSALFYGPDTNLSKFVEKRAIQEFDERLRNPVIPKIDEL
jgi:hypothetical protein